MSNIFKKIMGTDDDSYIDEREDRSPGFADASDPDDVSRPKAQFVLVKPGSRNELMQIADHLMKRKTVILNLEQVAKDTRRFVDFLSGVAYALSGQVKKVALNTYLIIPGGLSVSGDIFEDIENDLNF